MGRQWICSYLFKLSIVSLFFTCPIESSEGWAEATLQKMSLDEKIGQLIIVKAYSNASDAAKEGEYHHFVSYIENLIEEYHIGGLLLAYRWEPLLQKYFINHYQSLSKTPLLMMQDGEWGLAMRVSRAIAFPRNMTLGAIQDKHLIYRLGKEIGREYRSLGIHVNLAPVVDINTNAENSVMGTRSYGANPLAVVERAAEFSRGLKDAGVFACAKHFPGHGDTHVDSHHSLPILSLSRGRLEQVELEPYRVLISQGIPMIMIGHLHIPALDHQQDSVATLSQPIVSRLLKGEMQYKGLVITDALDMGGLPDRLSEEIALQALVAGNDLLLSPKNIPASIEQIKIAIAEGKFSIKELDLRVLKILKAKENMSISSTHDEIVTGEALSLQKQLYREAMTLVRNEGELLPLQPRDADEAALIQIGGDSASYFPERIKQAYGLPVHFLCSDCTVKQRQAILKKIENKRVALVAVYDTSFVDMTVGEVRRPELPKERFGISQGTASFIAELRQKGMKVALVMFTNPYGLKFVRDADSILMAYENCEEAEQAAAEVVLGVISANGRLPI